jgi:hypothetical protein
MEDHPPILNECVSAFEEGWFGNAIPCQQVRGIYGLCGQGTATLVVGEEGSVKNHEGAEWGVGSSKGNGSVKVKATGKTPVIARGLVWSEK